MYRRLSIPQVALSSAVEVNLIDQPPVEAKCRTGCLLFVVLEHTIAIRVRYPEVDAMGYLHHSRYLQYFEMGRIELLRAAGHSYADLERQGLFFVVVKVECRYKAPARFDQELTLLTRIVRQTVVRIDHAYELRREGQLLAEAATTIACVDRAGNPQQIPDFLGPHVS